MENPRKFSIWKYNAQSYKTMEAFALDPKANWLQTHKTSTDIKDSAVGVVNEWYRTQVKTLKGEMNLEQWNRWQKGFENKLSKALRDTENEQKRCTQIAEQIGNSKAFERQRKAYAKKCETLYDQLYSQYNPDNAEETARKWLEGKAKFLQNYPMLEEYQQLSKTWAAFGFYTYNGMTSCNNGLSTFLQTVYNDFMSAKTLVGIGGIDILKAA